MKRLMCTSLLSVFGAVSASAGPLVTVHFEGAVTSFSFSEDIALFPSLGGISANSLLSGSFVYDVSVSTDDDSANPSVGYYIAAMVSAEFVTGGFQASFSPFLSSTMMFINNATIGPPSDTFSAGGYDSKGALFGASDLRSFNFFGQTSNLSFLGSDAMQVLPEGGSFGYNDISFTESSSACCKQLVVHGSIASYTVEVATGISEPSTFFLLGSGLLGLAGRRQRRSR